jgi:hypothetical protein
MDGLTAGVKPATPIKKAEAAAFMAAVRDKGLKPLV